MWKKIIATYGVVNTTESILGVYDQLRDIKKNNNESIKDYIARIDRLISVLKSMNEEVTPASKKSYLLRGLAGLDEWEWDVKYITKDDNSENKWTVERYEVHLINQENSVKLDKLSSKSSNNSNKNNNNNNNTDSVYYTHNMNRGRGGYNRGGRGGSRGGGSGGVCFHYSRNGSCKFGDSCRFSHQNTQSSSSSPQTSQQSSSSSSTSYTSGDHVMKCFNCGGVGHRLTECASRKGVMRRNDNALVTNDNTQYNNNNNNNINNINNNNKSIHLNMNIDLEISDKIASFSNRLAVHIATISNLGKKNK